MEKLSELNHKLSFGKSPGDTPNQIEVQIQLLVKRVRLVAEYLRAVLQRRQRSSISCSKAEGNIPQIVVITSRQESNGNLEVNQNFQLRRRLHIQLRLMMESSNRNVQIFIPTMSTVGMLLCVVLNYAIIKVNDRGDLKIFLLMGTFVLVTVNTLIFFFGHHASQPLIHSSEMIVFWKEKLRGKLERRQVRCMRPIGFTLGAFFMAKRDTALDINDIILNTTINCLLS
ncbi:unnamed protein product [Orchesella dallaii]|uniref:Uncharacterized protein n=1 Tax=Orchesella dallaii TaxID=48710 RepID=A0ABP1S800_9HEXA